MRVMNQTEGKMVVTGLRDLILVIVEVKILVDAQAFWCI